MDLDSLERKYGKLPVAWSVVDVLQALLEALPHGSLVTLERIKQEIVEVDADPGMPALHVRLARTDSDFVSYLFQLAKAEAEFCEKCTFRQVDPTTWMVEQRQRPA